MAKRRRALINFNIPKVGRVTQSKTSLVNLAVGMGIVAGVWHVSSYIPYVGQYADKGKNFLRGLVGVGGARPSVNLTHFSRNVA